MQLRVGKVGVAGYQNGPSLFREGNQVVIVRATDPPWCRQLWIVLMLRDRAKGLHERDGVRDTEPPAELWPDQYSSQLIQQELRHHGQDLAPDHCVDDARGRPVRIDNS